MVEIVRMTTQQQPLEVGIPLYPFSHAGVFAKPPAGEDDDRLPSHVAPLPVSPPYEVELTPPPNNAPGRSAMPTSNSSDSGTWGSSSVPGVDVALLGHQGTPSYR